MIIRWGGHFISFNADIRSDEDFDFSTASVLDPELYYLVSAVAFEVL